ncbi:MAG: hypothetical protein QM736_00335 [Vicinamibacterales bacterium]
MITGTLVLASERRRRLERRGVERVHRVRGHRRHDQRIALERLDERFGACERIGRGLRVGHGELNHRLPEDAAQPRVSGGLRDLLFEVVHVGERRRARLDHLRRGEPRADAHELGRHGLRFRREDVLLQPVHQREVVREPAEHHHRRVRVRVD